MTQIEMTHLNASTRFYNKSIEKMETIDWEQRTFDLASKIYIEIISDSDYIVDNNFNMEVAIKKAKGFIDLYKEHLNN